MNKKHNRLIVIGDGIVYRYGNNYYVSGSSQLDFYECFDGIDEVIIWSRIYDISETDIPKYSMYDTSTLSKQVTFCGIFNQPSGLKGYIITMYERIKKLNKLFCKPALVICSPISVSQWIMWLLFRKRDLIFISRVIGDPDGIPDIKKSKAIWKVIVCFVKRLQVNYLAKSKLQTWVSSELEKKYRNPYVPSVIFHDGLIYDRQIVTEIKPRTKPELQLIFVGRLSPEKGINDLIDAVNMLSTSRIKLKIIGQGVEQENIRRKINEYNLEDKIILLGQKKWGQELFSEMRTSDILILPSYNEGLGMVLLEAMSNGITVIGSRVGGIPDVINPGLNGLLFTPGNVAELADAIKSLYDNEELRSKLCRNALITAHQNTRKMYIIICKK